MHRTARRGLALALGAVALAGSLSACGTSSAAPAGSLPTVSGAFGAPPTITFPSGSAPTALKVRILTAGHGPVVRVGNLLVANYVGQIWQGKVFDSSFARHVPAAFPIGVHKIIPGWDKTLIGLHAGSRVLLVVPPADGYGSAGKSSAGISGTDTLAFVVDVLASYSKTAEGQPATSTLRADVDGVSVSWPPGSPPSVHVAAGTAFPKKPVVTVLSTGTGRRIAPGLIILQFLAVDGKTGKALQSTWGSGLPDAETVGNPASPSVLDRFIGLTVGSRVLLRLPKSASGAPIAFAVDLVGQPTV
jgi:peptidylprolyl isomerase